MSLMIQADLELLCEIWRRTLHHHHHHHHYHHACTPVPFWRQNEPTVHSRQGLVISQIAATGNLYLVAKRAQGRCDAISHSSTGLSGLTAVEGCCSGGLDVGHWAADAVLQRPR